MLKLPCLFPTTYEVLTWGIRDLIKTPFVGLSFFICIALTLPVTADDNAGVGKYRNYTPEQLRELPEETISSEVPLMYRFAAQRGLSDGAELLFGMELNTLMYPGLHNFEEAVKAFQEDLGDKQTGILTVWQIDNLQQRAEMQKLGRLNFPNQWSSLKLDDLALVQGTVTILDERIAWPINHVKINCYKQSSSCLWDQINVSVPDEDSLLQSYHVIEASPDFYDIILWTENEIEATPSGSTPAACRTTSLSLNFKTKEFYQITRNAGGDCEALGVMFEPLDKPRISQIVDGGEIISEEFTKVEQAAFDVLSSDFRKQVSKLISEEEAAVQKKTD